MFILGLTGGIGMGKSTASEILRGFGFSVYDADRAVHGLLKKGGRAVKPISALFPEAVKRTGIDRKILGELVFHNRAKLKKLESILHPLVRAEERQFLTKARKKKAQAAILEIPLLFETGADRRCDAVLCVTAPKAVQKTRVMKRGGMTEAKFRAILKLQMKDSERRKKADYIIHTGKSYADTRKQVTRILRSLGLTFPETSNS